MFFSFVFGVINKYANVITTNSTTTTTNIDDDLLTFITNTLNGSMNELMNDHEQTNRLTNAKIMAIKFKTYSQNKPDPVVVINYLK